MASPAVDETAEAPVEAGTADDVGHEGVAGDEGAAGERDGERLEVDPVAASADPLGEVLGGEAPQAALDVALGGLAWSGSR